MEFPHLLRLMEGNQFDTIYHEHFSYFSFLTAEKIFAAFGLDAFRCGGVVHARRIVAHLSAATREDSSKPVSAPGARTDSAGRRCRLSSVDTYRSFAEKVKETKRKLLEFLIEVKQAGKSIAGYGAPGKGNTLLNYCGIRTDFLDYTVDRNPYKHGQFLARHAHSDLCSGKDSRDADRITC